MDSSEVCLLVQTCLQSFNGWTVSVQAQKSATVAYVDFAKVFDYGLTF